MLNAYIEESGTLKGIELSEGEARVPVWYDLMNPTAEEERLVEARLGIDVPTRADARKLDPSQRLYMDRGAIIMSESFLDSANTKSPRMCEVTWVLKGAQLVTVRYDELPAVSQVAAQALKPGSGCRSGEQVLRLMIGSVVDSIGGALEGIGGRLNELSQRIFRDKAGRQAEARQFKQILLSLGREEDLLDKARDSLINVGRLAVFLSQAVDHGAAEKSLQVFLKTEGKDIEALGVYSTHISQKINFLLETTLGLVSVEQSMITKVFSVVAVIFLPPTLIASIYGMNFDKMPEIGWIYGYPLALVLMALSGLLPVWYFRQKGWL
jgi:magnesium transporter